MKLFISLVLLILISFAVPASGEPTLVNTIAVPQSSKIRTTVGFNFEVPVLDFEITKKSQDNGVTFRPNDLVKCGVNFGLDGFDLGVAVPLPESEQSIRQKGATNEFDIRLAHFGRQFGGDAFYHRSSGFYTDSKSSSSSHSAIYTQRPDLNSHFFGGNLYYSFSPQRFSLKKLNNSDAGTTGGSWVGFSSISEFYMRGALPLLAGETLMGITARTLSMGGGYAYQYSMKHSALTGQFLIGLGPQEQIVYLINQQSEGIKLSEQANLLGSYSYFWRHWSSGVNFYVNSVTGDVGDEYKLTATGLGATTYLRRNL